jgi:glycosyltransferase involved in cell wall biosynthesis
MQRLNILVIHEVSYAKKLVYEYQLFPELLAKKGHNVSVMDYDDTGDNIHQKRKYSRTGIAEVTLENVPYINFPIIKNITGRINHKRLIKTKLQNREIDVVFLYSVFINGTNTLRLCKKYNIPVIYRVLDAYHLLRRNYFTMLPLYLGERYIYRNADVVCLINEAMAEYVNKVAGKNIEDRIKVLIHGVDMSFFERKEKNKELLNRYGLSETDRIFIFLGTTYVFSGIDVIVEKFEKIRNKIPNAKLLVVGRGDLDDKLKKLVNEKNLHDCVILTGLRPYNEMPDFIKIADLSLNPFFINIITKDIIPIKVLNCLAGGSPVLCTRIRDVVKYFPEHESGVVYGDIENIDRFIDKMIELIYNDTLLDELSKNSIKHIKDNFSQDDQIEKLEDLLLSAVRKQ